MGVFKRIEGLLEQILLHIKYVEINTNPSIGTKDAKMVEREYVGRDGEVAEGEVGMPSEEDLYWNESKYTRDREDDV